MGNKNEGQETASAQNPFFSDWGTPFETPDFSKIKNDDFLPAFREAIKENREEIDKIADNAEESTFDNTIVAMEDSGLMLRKVENIFDNLQSANTNDEIQNIAKEIAPELSKLNDDINLNEKLFARVKALYDKKDGLGLNPIQTKLLKDYYKSFVRGGANLAPEQKERFRKINEELSLLSLTFKENVLKETNKFELVLDKKEDLAGLPQGIRDAAAEEAKTRGYEGKWVFTIQKPSLIPFLTYSDKRDLREKMFKAYTMQGNHDDSLDNKETVKKIVNLRLERAKLLGFNNHAEYVLDENMAKTPDKVYELMYKVWKPAVANAKKEANELQAMIDKEGGNFKLQPWDWWYYSEKLRKEKYDLDEEQLRPYFKLENVREGAFAVANKLYGLTFTKRDDIPKYHPDVEVFEVKDTNGAHLGILYLDYFPRDSKRGGAWMSAYRKQYRMNGKNITPIICNVCNFTKPTGDTPSLLTFEEASTLFHEFGHALQGLLSNCDYYSQSGTSVPRDFVELPSQIMENWVSEPEVLKMFAKNYKTGEVIPDELIEKIQKTSKFNQGFITTEYMAAAFLDMDWHTITEPMTGDVNEFETKAMDKIGLIPEIVVRYRSPYFMHAFANGYDAGYYSYIWAGVLDADAFQAFKETSLFDKETASKFRKYILSAGSTEEAMDLYKKFRGAEPSIEPLLKRRGLI